jgi:alpha-tubulin suppressor-like RCC1 family protein
MYSFLSSLLSFSEPAGGKISAAEDHFVFITPDGVYSCGSGYYGQLGNYGTNSQPSKITFPIDSDPIKQVCTGYEMTGFLTETGQVYVCGKNDEDERLCVCYGRRISASGYYDDYSDIMEPTRLEFPESIRRISFSPDSVAFLSCSGKIYTSEYFSVSRSGEGFRNIHDPRGFSCIAEFELPPKVGFVKEVFYDGKSHFIFLNDFGDVYVCFFIRESWKTKKINFPPEAGAIKQIGSGLKDLDMFLTESGKIYMYGIILEEDAAPKALTSRQIGSLMPTSSSTPTGLSKPILLELPEPIKQMSLAYRNGALLSFSGEVYLFVRREHDPLSPITVPRKLDFPLPISIKEISCGYGYTLFLTHSDEVYFYGKANYEFEYGSTAIIEDDERIDDFLMEYSTPTKIFPL